MKVAGVLLAAGSGVRFTGDRHKLAADLAGKPVGQHALDHLVEAGLDHTIVVSGATRLSIPDGVHEVINVHWQSGQASSLQCAITAAQQLNVEAIVVGLADQPFVPASAWQAVASTHDDAQIAIAIFDGIVGPTPVRLLRSVWHLLPTTGDHGARDLIRLHPDWVSGVSCSGSPIDIDTVEDLRRWTNC